MDKSRPQIPTADSFRLLDQPVEFDGSQPDTEADDIRLSLALARSRREELTVIELDNPTTTTFALFL